MSNCNRDCMEVSDLKQIHSHPLLITLQLDRAAVGRIFRCVEFLEQLTYRD